MDQKRGSYVLYFDIETTADPAGGVFGLERLSPPGAMPMSEARAEALPLESCVTNAWPLKKRGKLHWHIDYLLINRHTELAGEAVLENEIECTISKRIALMSGVTVPVPGFGSSDCRAKCAAHLYLLPSDFGFFDKEPPRRRRSQA